MFRYAPTWLLCLILISGCDNKKTAQDYLSSGAAFYQQQQLEKARIEYRNALALDPNNAAAHYGLATIARDKQETGALQFHLDKAIQHNPQNADWQFEYGEMALLTGDLTAAAATERRLRELRPDSLHSLQLSLALAVAQGRWADATRYADSGLKAYPESADLWGLVAVSAKKQQHWEDALRALNKAIALSDEPLQYRLLRIEVNQERGDLEATIADLSELIDHSTEPEAQILQLTKLLYQRDGHDATVAALQRYIEQYPEAYSLQTLHVDLVKAHDPQEAGRLLDHYIQIAKNPTGLVFYRVSAALANNNPALAKQDLQALLTSDSTDEKARLEAKALLAEIAWLEQDWQVTETYVDQVLSGDSSHKSALLLKGKLLLRKNHSDDAVAYFNKVLSTDRDSIAALEALALINQQQGKMGVAADYYQHILERDPTNYDAMRFAIAESFGKGHLANADTLLTQALQAYPQDTAFLSVKLQVVAMLGNMAEANSLLTQLRTMKVDAADLLFFQGFIKQKQGDNKAAMGLFGEAVTQRGEYEKALQAMFASAQSADDIPGFKQFLARHLKSHPEDRSALLVQARLAQPEESAGLISALEKALQSAPDWSAGTVALADFYRQKGDAKKAHELLAAHYQSHPGATVGITYARYLEKLGSAEQAEKLYEELLAGNPNNEIIRNNYALFLLTTIQSPQAARKALQLTEGFSGTDSPALLDTYGSALLKTQNTDKAVFIFKKALALADIAEIRLHYIDALYAAGKKTEALEILAELEQSAAAAKDVELANKIAELRKRVR